MEEVGFSSVFQIKPYLLSLCVLEVFCLLHLHCCLLGLTTILLSEKERPKRSLCSPFLYFINEESPWKVNERSRSHSHPVMLLRPEALFWLQEWGSPHCVWLTVTDRLPHSISLLCFNHYFPQVFFLDLKFFFHMNCWNLRLYLGAQFWFIILILEPLLWKSHS